MGREDIRKKWKNKEFAEVTNKVNLHNNEKVITNVSRNTSQTQINNSPNMQTNTIWERIMQNANQIINRTNKVDNANKNILNYIKSRDKNEYSKLKNSKTNPIEIIEDTGRSILGTVYGGIRGGVRALGQTEFLSQQRSDEYRRYNARQTEIQEKRKNKTIEEELEYNKKQVQDSNNVKGILLQKQPNINESSSMQFFNEKEEEISNKILENAEKAKTRIGKYIAGQVAPSMGQSLVGTGLDIMAPGIGSAYRILSYSGDYTQDGLNKGMNENQASMYGITMAGVETVMDTIGDKLKGVAIGESKEANGLKELIKTGAKELGINSFFEGSGEALTEPLQEVVSKMYGGSEDFENIGQRMSEAFLAGAVSELLMTGGSLGYGSSVNVLNKMQNGEKVTVEEISDALKEINKKEEVNIEQVLKNNLEFAEKNLIQENQQEINEETNQKLEDIATELDRDEATKLTGFNNYKKINQIQNSGLTDFQKEKIYNMANKYKLSDKDIQYLIDNTKKGKYERNEQATIDNEQVLNNNQQVIPENSKTAQNQMSGKIDSNVQNEGKINYNTQENLLNYQNSAQKYNIDLNDDTVKAIFGTADRRGIKVNYNDTIFTNSNQNAIWRLNEDGSREIILNPDADTTKALQSIQVHELTHDMEGTKEYEALSKVVLDKMKTQEGYQESFDELSEMYSKVYDKNSENFNALVEQEAVADFLGENLGNQEFLNELVNSQPRSTIQKIYDWIVDKINKLTGYNKEKLYWQDVKTKFENAFNSDFNNENQNSKYSVETTSDGTMYVRDEQNKYIKSDGTKMTPREVYNSLVGKTIDLGNGEKAYILKNLPNKNMYNELFKRYPKYLDNIQNIKELNNNVNFNIEELLSNSDKIIEDEQDTANRHQRQGIVSFDTRTVNFYDGNNAYTIDFSIAKLKDGNKVAYAKRRYSLNNNLTQKIKAEETRSSQSPLNQQPLSNNSIPNLDTNVNNGNTTKYSMQEKENNTGKWQEFLQKHSINKGTKTTINQVKLPGMPIEEYQKVLDNAKFIPQEDKKNLLSYLDNINRNKTSLNEFKNTVNELNNEYKKLDDETLNTNLTYNTGRKEIYQKYLNSKNKYDVSSLKNAKDIIKANSQGKRTKSQWINIAKQIGTEIANKSNTEIEEIAYRTWQDERPSSKESLNKQGEKFINFTSDEWINTIYNSVKEQREKFSISDKASNNIESQRNNKEIENSTQSSFLVSQNNDEKINLLPKTKVESPETKQRKHYKSIMQSSETSAEAKKIAKELLGSDTYVPDSNKAQIERADQRISSNPDNELIVLTSKIDNGDRLNATDIAVSERLIEYYSKIGDAEKLQTAIQNTALAGTQLGQSVQALSLINRQTSIGQVTYIERSIEKLNKEILNKKGYTQNEDGKILDRKGQDVTEKVELFNFTPEMQEKILNSNKDNLNSILDEVYKELGNQVSKSTQQKIDSWRYFAMLGNVKTHGRNIIGNIGMGKTQRVKDKIAGGIEDVAGILNPNMERTKTLRKTNKITREFAKNDIKNVATELGLDSNKYTAQNRLQDNMREFKGDVLNNTIGKVYEINNTALEVEDGWGLKSAYVKAFGDYITANRLDVNNISDKNLRKARKYAIDQAQEATFHQANAIASAINQFSKTKGKFITDAILPFVKTPLNVAKAGIEYNPAGLVYNSIKGIHDLNTGKITVNKYIDNISKGLTGTGIALMGYALAEAGIIKASGGDDDKEKYDQERGNQAYSIKIGDNTYTLDWLAPIGIPLFVGVEAHEIIKTKKEEKTSTSTDDDTIYKQGLESATNLLNAFTTSMNPMAEMSMISGLTSALRSYDSDTANMLASMGSNMATSYINQFVPTLLGQVARTTDDKERTTTSTATGIFSKAVDQTKNQMMAKIPVLRQQLPVATDIWGQEKDNDDNIARRAFETFIAPYTRKDVQTVKVDTELNDLYDRTGDASIYPDKINKKITINGSDYRLTNEEFIKYSKEYGQTSFDLINSLCSLSDYEGLTDEEKQKAISNIYSYAKEVNKVNYSKKVDNEFETSDLYNVMSKISSNAEKSKYLIYLSEMSVNDIKDKDKKNYILNSNMKDSTKELIYSTSLGKKDELYQILYDIDKVNINAYLDYSIQEIKGDEDENSEIEGETISGSKKNNLSNYLNSNLKLSLFDRLYIYGKSYTLNSKERAIIDNGIKNSSLTDEERLNAYKKLSPNIVKYKDGRISWK